MWKLGGFPQILNACEGGFYSNKFFLDDIWIFYWIIQSAGIFHCCNCNRKYLYFLPFVDWKDPMIRWGMNARPESEPGHGSSQGSIFIFSLNIFCVPNYYPHHQMSLSSTRSPRSPRSPRSSYHNCCDISVPQSER